MDVVTFGVIVGIIVLFLCAVCLITIEGTCKRRSSQLSAKHALIFTGFVFCLIISTLSLTKSSPHSLTDTHQTMSFFSQNQISFSLLLLLLSGRVLGSASDLCSQPGSCSTPVVDHHHHDHHHSCDHHHHLHHDHPKHDGERRKLLPEELAEEEDMLLYGFGPVHHDHGHGHSVDHSRLSGLGMVCVLIIWKMWLFVWVDVMKLLEFCVCTGLWWSALGCSLLVSLASLICLIMLPLIFSKLLYLCFLMS